MFEKSFIFCFKLFAILGIIVFIAAFSTSVWILRNIHVAYSTGKEKCRECGYEYMEKESGTNHVYQLLNDPINPQQPKLDKAIVWIIFSIALFSIAVLMVVLYYMFNTTPNTSNFITDWRKTGIIPLTKALIYLRYIFLRAILGIGLLVFFASKKQLLIPDLNVKVNSENATEEVKDEESDDTKKDKVAKDVQSTIKRQWLILGTMAFTIIIMKTFYVPDIDNSANEHYIPSGLLWATEGTLLLSVLLLTSLTKYNADLQYIFRNKYIQKTKSLNQTITTLLASPVFKDYFVKNVKRMEKGGSEPFHPYQVGRLAQEGNLFMYLDHHESGNHELKFMEKEERKGGSTAKNKKATWGPAVNRVRADMNSLRQAHQEMDEILKKGQLRFTLIYSIPFIVLMYLVFHNSFKTNATRTTMSCVVILIIMMTFLISSNFTGMLRV